MGIDLALIGALTFGVFLSRKFFRGDIFTPLCVYVSAWSACLLLFRLRFVAYNQLEPRTWLLIAGGMLSFSGGCLLGALRPTKRRRGSQCECASLSAFRLAILALLVLNVVGAVFFAARIARLYGLQSYLTDPSIIRAGAGQWTSMGALGALVLLAYPLFVCSLIYVFDTRRLTWLAVLGLAVPVAETYLGTGRGDLISYMVCSFFLWVYYNKLRKLEVKVVLALGVGVVLVLSYFLAIGALYHKVVTFNSPASQYATVGSRSSLELGLLNPYTYVTGSFPTFQAAIRDVRHWSWGEMSFYPAARVLYKAGILEKNPRATEFTFYYVPIPFNNYTWLFAFYSDFGTLGVLLLPGAVGWLETRMYIRMRESPTVFSVSGTAAVVTASVFTTMGIVQYDFTLWYFLLVMFVVSRATAVRHRSRGPARGPGFYVHPEQRGWVAGREACSAISGPPGEGNGGSGQRS